MPLLVRARSNLLTDFFSFPPPSFSSPQFLLDHRPKIKRSSERLWLAKMRCCYIFFALAATATSAGAASIAEEEKSQDAPIPSLFSSDSTPSSAGSSGGVFGASTGGGVMVSAIQNSNLRNLACIGYLIILLYEITSSCGQI